MPFKPSSACEGGRGSRLPRCHGRNRYNSLTYPQFGNGAALDNDFCVLSKTGRVAVRWSRPIEGAPKAVTLSREADVPVHTLPLTGQETGVDLGIESFATLSDGTRIFSPA